MTFSHVHMLVKHMRDIHNKDVTLASLEVSKKELIDLCKRGSVMYYDCSLLIKAVTDYHLSFFWNILSMKIALQSINDNEAAFIVGPNLLIDIFWKLLFSFSHYTWQDKKNNWISFLKHCF